MEAKNCKQQHNNNNRFCLSGIIYCVAALGVAGGYMGGGQFLNIYTDADKVEPDR